MAKSSGIGLSEKFIKDDSSKEQLEKFDTMVKTVVDTLDYISFEKNNGKVDFNIEGPGDVQQKANLLKFLSILYKQTKAYETVLDKKIKVELESGMQFDEQLFILIDKVKDKNKNNELVDLEFELESIFDTMNLEIDVLMKALSGETKDLSNEVNLNNKKNTKEYNVVSTDTEDFASKRPNATEDIDYKFESKVRQEKIDVLIKAVPALKTNTEKLFTDFEKNLKIAIAASKGSDKRKLERTLKKLEEDRDGFKKEFFVDLAKMESALVGGDEDTIESAYVKIQGHLNKLDNTLLLQEKLLRANGVWDKFNTNPPKYFVYADKVVGMPIGMRRVIDEWKQMAPDFDYIIEKLQTGLNPNDEFKLVADGSYNYLGAELDSFRKVRRATETSEEGDKITDRYKGNTQFTKIKANANLLDLKRTAIENLNWLDAQNGMAPVINNFLAKVGNGWDIPEKYRDFKHEFKDGGVLADYDFGKRYKNDRLEAKRELHKFLWTMQERIKADESTGTPYKTIRILGTMFDADTETDVNSSDIDNARILLLSGKISDDNVFDFLCDFDSDGKVTGANKDKKFSKKNRLDSGSVTGIQMLNMMRGHANTKKTKDRLTIIEGPKTDAMFLSMFQTVLNDTEKAKYDTTNTSLTDALHAEILKVKQKQKQNSHYTRASFITFLKKNPTYKGFLINAVKKDDIEVFSSLHNKVETKEKIAAMDGSVDQVYYNKIDQIRGKDNFKKLAKKLDAATLTNVRAGIGKQVFRVAGTIMNIITAKTTDEAVRNALTGALGISSQIIKKNYTQIEYKSMLGKIFDKITGNIEFDLGSLANITKDTTPGDILKNLGLWTEFTNTSANYGDTKSVKIGVKFYPPVVALGGSKGIQIEKNRIDLQNAGNLNAEAVKRRGFGGELSVNILKPWKSKLFFEVGREHDYIAGIMQQEYNDHMIVSSMFGLTGDKIGGYRFGNEVESGEDGSLSALWVKGEGFENNPTGVRDILSTYFATVNNNLSTKDSVLLRARKASLGKSKENIEKDLRALGVKPDDKKEKKIWKTKKKALEHQIEIIDDEIQLVDDLPNMMKNSAMVKEVQSEVKKDLTDLISTSAGWKTMSKEQKRLFIKQYLAAYMQGYLLSVKTRRQEAVANGLKRGGWKATLDSTEMAKDFITYGGPAGILKNIGQNIVFGGMIKSYRMHYAVDAANMANNYDKANRLEQRNLELESLPAVQIHLLEQLKMLGDVTVTLVDNKLVLGGADLHKLNISYLPGVKDQFSYRVNASGEEELIIGNVGKIGTMNYYKNEGTEVHLFLGNNRAVNTVRLSGYNQPSTVIDAIGFEPRSVEIGQDGIDDLKSQVTLSDFFGLSTLLVARERLVVIKAIHAYLSQDPENIARSKAGRLVVGIKTGVTEIDGIDDVEFSRTETPEANLDPVAANNKVTIEFNYSRTVEVPGYNRDVPVNFENTITGQITDTFRESIASSEYTGDNRRLFKDYLSKASTDLDYSEAYIKLCTIAWAGNDQKIKLFLSNKTNEEKRLIVNEFKGIFATNEKAHNRSTIDSVIVSHGTAFTRLDWNTGGNLSNITNSLKTYRKDIVDDIKSGPSDIEHKKIDPNLFGFTAFYRTASGKDARKYSMTALGATRMLGNKSVDLKTDSNERKAVFGDGGPFFKSLEKSKKDVKDIVKQVNESLKKQNPGLRDLTKAEVLKLLKNNNETIELDNVKYTIKPDIDYLFYLLGECANESFGLKLKFKVEGPKKIKKTITGNAETNKIAKTGVDVGEGLVVAETYLGVMKEDGMTVQGSMPSVDGFRDEHDPGEYKDEFTDEHDSGETRTRGNVITPGGHDPGGNRRRGSGITTGGNE